MIDFERKEHYGLSDLLRIVALLRSEDGCPWDRVQTHASLRRSLLEEAYEAAEAIDREDPALLKEELGDLLLQVVFHADIERQAGDFTMDDVADGEGPLPPRRPACPRRTPRLSSPLLWLPSPRPCNERVNGRERLTVSGVEDVARFDETCIVMSTCVGELVVTGEGLHIGKLTLDGGELHVDGHIDSISYEEPAAGRTSLLSRLFG